MTLVRTDEAKARAEFLKRCEQITATETAQDRKCSSQINRRLGELEKLITAAYEDKVAGRIPEDICVNLLNRYVEEKNKLKAEFSEIEKRQAEANNDKADVDEFIRRLKIFMEVPELTREMCMELIEFVTVDKCPGRYSKAPREIHIYYKLIDKHPIPEKKYANNSTCEDS